MAISRAKQHCQAVVCSRCCSVCVTPQAVGGIDKLKDNVDTLIIIPNDQLLAEVQDRSTSLTDAFKLADTVLLQVCVCNWGRVWPPLAGNYSNLNAATSLFQCRTTPQFSDGRIAVDL
jgi:hypothetical protein